MGTGCEMFILLSVGVVTVSCALLGQHPTTGLHQSEHDLLSVRSRNRRNATLEENMYPEVFSIAYLSSIPSVSCCTLSLGMKEKRQQKGRVCEQEVKQRVQGPAITASAQECFYECLFQLMRLTDEVGKVMARSALKHFAARLPSDTVVDITAMCMNQGTTNAAENEYGCNPSSMNIVYCMEEAINLFCPQGRQRETPKCIKYMRTLKKKYPHTEVP